MKIAYLTSEYPHNAVDNSSGGIGTSIYNLAQGLKELEQEVSIIVYNQKKDEVIEDNTVKIYKIKNVKFKGLSWWLTRKKIEKTINRLYKEKAIDILETPDWTGITSFMNLSCPNIIKLHGSDTYFCHLEKRPVKWINKFHEKRALQNADGHISVSQFTADVTNKIFKSNYKFKIIPNGINIKLFEPDEKSKSLNNFKILYFGTIIRKKGALELPHIFNKVVSVSPKTELIMIGQDSYDIKTKSSSTYSLMIPLFSKIALKQHKYLGKVPYQEVKKYIEQASVVVFPSFIEALPLSWLEALAMKKIIIASNIGWANEIIKNEKNGFMVDPKDHNKFAETIINVLNKKVDVNYISNQARNTILENFSNLKVAKKNLRFYKKIIHG